MRPHFHPDPHGELLIYYPPKEGLDFCIGIDSSEGVQGGDLSVAQVVEMTSMTQVATWRGLYKPQEWGHLTALLGLWYNTALLTYETDPSAHGRDACQRAKDLGYPRLYFRQRLDKVKVETTDVLGWRTDRKTKQSLMNSIREAVSLEIPIHDERTLHEMVSMRYDDNREPYSQTHDDCVMALGLAYMGRAWAFQHSDVREAVRKEPLTLAQREWQSWERETSHGDGKPPVTATGIINPNGA